MKKLLTILLALLSIVGFSQQQMMQMLAPLDTISINYKARVLADDGTLIDISNVDNNIAITRAAGVLDNAVLMMTPSAYKTSKLYSVLPTSGTGDFTVVRNTAKTIVNENGLLESVAANIAGIDYSSGKPVTLLEPADTNLITYPRSFGNAYWTKSGATIEGDPSTAGVDILSGWDFTSGWTATTDVTIDDANSFTTTAAFVGVYKAVMTIGGFYKIRIAGSTTSTIIQLQNVSHSPSMSGTFDEIFYCEATATNFYLRVNSIGVTDITTLELQEVTGFPSPSSDYLLESYKLVASANDGYIKLATPLGSAARTNSIYVKRATGTGVVSLIDPSETDIPITVTGSWQRFEASATGTQIGLKLATSGDAVYIAMAQTEAFYATSLMQGTEGSTTTRGADAIDLATLQSSVILGSTTGMIYFEVSGDVGTGKDLWLFEDTGGGDELGLRFNADETWQWYDHHSTELIGTASTSSTTRIAITWSGTAAIISKDGASEVITLDAAFDAITDISLGASFELGKTSNIIMDKDYWTAANLNTLTE